MTVAEIFECIMLICFGFSWPINVVKNYRAKTAKSMSLPFILLILFGYFAGVASKFIKLALEGTPLSYVLIIYFINIASLLANLVVYFINLRRDKLAEKAAVQETAEETSETQDTDAPAD